MLDANVYSAKQHHGDGPENRTRDDRSPIGDWRDVDTGYAVNPEKNELIHCENGEDRGSELLHREHAHQEMKADGDEDNETQGKRVLPEYRALRYIENDADDPR